MNHDPEFEKYWNGIKPIVQEAWDNVDKVGKEALKASFEKFCKFVQRAAGELWNAVKAGFDLVRTALRSLWNVIRGV